MSIESIEEEEERKGGGGLLWGKGLLSLIVHYMVFLFNFVKRNIMLRRGEEGGRQGRESG